MNDIDKRERERENSLDLNDKIIFNWNEYPETVCQKLFEAII